MKTTASRKIHSYHLALEITYSLMNPKMILHLLKINKDGEKVLKIKIQSFIVKVFT